MFPHLHCTQHLLSINNMKTIILVCIIALGLADPQYGRPNQKHVAIVREDRQDDGNGRFSYSFEAENGISVAAAGSPGSKGQSNINGNFRFRLDDGRVAEVTYVADEFGYRPESPLIPTPHPLPAHAIEQIRFAEGQTRRLG
ncbi:cuticle protein AM1199-like [Penaeus japonicus]|uniref:cuticle protein AM1199-like n=1 Tax=Penaeus japonicus TaxID=27405 RepID=UPI001C70C51A|nr:cuticle protein AM1199-like [Penaeus japonicus]